LKKIAIVVQRYGKEIVGGSESLTMQYAQNLKGIYDIDILTTTCINYITWENHYPEGISIIDDINVIRFKTVQPRINDEFELLSYNQFEKVRNNEPTELIDDKKWINLQGPYCPDLLSFISEHHHKYNVFIFITYLYYPFVYGLPLVAYKSIVVTTAHDEPCIKFSIFKNIFNIPRFFCFLTEEEKDFVHKLFKNNYIKHDITGSGIEVPDKINPEDFKKKYNINEKYIVYLGRLDNGKGVGDLLKYFIEYKKNYPSEMKLVLIGSGSLEIPKRDDIVPVGFVNEQDKFNGIAGAEIMISSSKYESLCIALLEGLALGIPAIVNGECEVLKGHILKGKTGYYYTNQQEFIDAAHKLISSKDKNKEIRKRAVEYINNNYTWNKVVKKLCDAIEYASEAKNEK
jgi:glycosyltransferase involved in cell wall biosynthesis